MNHYTVSLCGPRGSGIWLVDHMETPVANPRGWDLPAHATSHDHFLASQKGDVQVN